MAPRVKKRSTVYELCKKRIELKNRFQNSQSQTSINDVQLRINAQKKWIEPNESANMLEMCQKYQEHYQQKLDNINVEPQIDTMSNESESSGENLNNFLEKVPVEDQDSQTNSWEQKQLLEKKKLICSICSALFLNKTILNRHTQKYHAKRRGRRGTPVECNVCQMKFSSKKAYTIHYRIHTRKTYVCPSCNRLCFFAISHACKKKPKQNVWDACKEALIDKTFQPVSSLNFQSVPKLPITKDAVFFESLESKNFKQTLDKIIAKYKPLLEKNKISHSSLNNISCVQDSVEQQLTEFKNIDDFQSDSLKIIKTESINSPEIDDTKLFCNICNMSFDVIEKYEAHYSIHLGDEFCQIKEGDEELHVCSVCGNCFLEIDAFKAHKLTHLNEEWSDVKCETN